MYFYHTSIYRLCVEVVQKLWKFIAKSNTFETLSIALKTGHSLVKFANILRGEHILNDNEEGIRIIDQFISYFKNWTGDVATHALRTIKERNCNNPKVLPLAEDMKHLNSVVRKRISALKSEPIETSNRTAWYELSKLTLAHIVIFNRKRVGETQRLTVDTYYKKINASMDQDVKNCLSELRGQVGRIIDKNGNTGKTRSRGCNFIN